MQLHLQRGPLRVQLQVQSYSAADVQLHAYSVSVQPGALHMQLHVQRASLHMQKERCICSPPRCKCSPPRCTCSSAGCMCR